MHPSPLLRAALSAALLLLTSSGQGAVTGPFQTHESIRNEVRAFLLKRNRSAGSDMEVQVNSLDPRLRLALCDRPLEVFLPPSAPAVGRVTTGVRCTGKRPWSLYLPSRVSLFAQVVVARRDLARGKPIPRAALTLERRDLARQRRGYFLQIDEVAGKEAHRRVGRGAVLNPGLVQDPPAVHRGAIVSIVARISGIEARMKGKALAEGTLGQRIRVENLSSGRELEARVVSAGTVRVDIWGRREQRRK
jgi:flagella basal body P-ring formation protein FlgA